MSSARPSQSGRFQYLDLLGKGGMGEVWRARDTQLSRDVAIKVVVSDDPAFTSILKDEAQTLAGMPAHPNIVVLHDILIEDGKIALVMEYLAGASLDHQLKQSTPVSWSEMSHIMGKVLLGVSHAHQHRVIHRDLKPENIMLAPGAVPGNPMTSGLVKVLDFGIARAQQATRTTHTRSTMGTFAYMSPEQIMGQGQGPYTDVYALGLILYRLATGQFPFGDPDTMTEGAFVNAHLHQKPTRPNAFNPAIPEALESVILQAIDKNPKARFSDAEAMRLAVLPVLEALKEGRRTGPLPVRPSGGTRLDPKVHGGPNAAPANLAKPLYRRTWFLAVTACLGLWLAAKALGGADSKDAVPVKQAASMLNPQAVPIRAGVLMTADHRRIAIPPFFMGQTPITQDQFASFVRESGYAPAGDWQQPGHGNHPVVNVSYRDAVQYAQWLSKKSGENWGLPSREQFEFAAQNGGQPVAYPWGNRMPNPSLARFASNGTVPVGSYAANALGLYDMAGNCWQWTSTATPEGQQVVKGGSWADAPELLKVDVEGKLDPRDHGPKLGFRLVRNK